MALFKMRGEPRARRFAQSIDADATDRCLPAIPVSVREKKKKKKKKNSKYLRHYLRALRHSRALTYNINVWLGDMCLHSVYFLWARSPRLAYGCLLFLLTSLKF